MKLVKIYEEVLSESGAKSCIATFGKELFDPQLSRDGDGVEPNTKTEDEYIKLISQFTEYHHGKFIKPKFIEAMKNLKGCMSTYPEVLSPEGVVYRGLNMPLSKLLLQFNDIEDDLNRGGEFDFIYKPTAIIQSWTSDENAAWDFTNSVGWLVRYMEKFEGVGNNKDELSKFVNELLLDIDNITCPVVISLKTNKDDFLFKSRYFMFLSQHEYEEELLRINNNPTKVMAKIQKNIFKPVYEILKVIKLYGG